MDKNLLDLYNIPKELLVHIYTNLYFENKNLLNIDLLSGLINNSNGEYSKINRDEQIIINFADEYI
jgi:hypothetical protein